jgi:hypothetical protein
VGTQPFGRRADGNHLAVRGRILLFENPRITFPDDFPVLDDDASEWARIALARQLDRTPHVVELFQLISRRIQLSKNIGRRCVAVHDIIRNLVF